jgi:hypothetical protein
MDDADSLGVIGGPRLVLGQANLDNYLIVVAGD